MMTISVQSWWFCLCAVATINIFAWALVAKTHRQRQHELPADVYMLRRIQLTLSAVYVLGCAFRSVLPVYDIPRLVMFDSWLSSVVVGRSVATIAELCFVAQLAVMLYELSRAVGSSFARRVSLIVVPLIAIAESFSWYSVLTTANIGHVVEESLWGITAGLMVVSLVAIRPRCTGRLRYVLDACCVAGIGYVAFMFLVDVPMYWSRWLADEAVGRSYLSIAQGLSDVSGRWTVSHRWQDWRHEVPWMTLYFSVAVWFSMSLIHAPVARMRNSLDVKRRISMSVIKNDF
jgi:hypothetical protein